MINVGVSVKFQKNIMHVKKDYILNPTTCSCENIEYLTNTIDDPMIA